MSLTTPEPEPTVYNKADYIAFGCITGIIALIFAGVLTALFVTSDFYRASLFRTALSPLIVDAPLPEQERQQIQNDLDQVLKAYEDGQVTLKQLQMLAEEMSGSPTLLAGAVAGAYDVHVEPSTLGEKQRREAKLILYRFGQAGIDGRIEQPIVQRVGRLLREKAPRGGWLWKSDLSAGEIDLLIREAEAALPPETVSDTVSAPVSVPQEALPAETAPSPAPDADGPDDAAGLDEPVFPDVSRALAREVNAKLGKDIIKF